MTETNNQTPSKSNQDSDENIKVAGLRPFQFITIVVLVMMAFTLPQINDKFGRIIEVSSNIKQAKKESKTAAKYLDEYNECTKKLFSDSNNCIAGVITRYEKTNKEDEAREAFRLAKLLPKPDGTI